MTYYYARTLELPFDAATAATREVLAQEAHEALQLEDKVGTMLPCNVVVQQLAEGRTEVAAIDPVASMQAIDNLDLKAKAAEVAARLRAALDRL